MGTNKLLLAQLLSQVLNHNCPHLVMNKNKKKRTPKVTITAYYRIY